MKKEKIKILHKLNNQKETRIGNYLLDGYCIQNKTVYGCYFHYYSEDCPTVKKIKSYKWLEKLRRCKRRI